MTQMFLRESRISLDLKHPNIVEFIKAGQFGGQLFIVMEYVDGVDAEAARKDRGGTVLPEDVISVGLQILDALGYAHAKGIVHRDIKPGNVLLTGNPGAYHAKVTDFGLSRNYRAAGMSGITRENDVRGSIPYMSPEQVLDPRKADQRTDVFNLGATLYHLLVGDYIYDFSDGESPLTTVVKCEVVPIKKRGARVPANLAKVIDRAIQKAPEKRFQTAAEMRQALVDASA